MASKMFEWNQHRGNSFHMDYSTDVCWAVEFLHTSAELVLISAVKTPPCVQFLWLACSCCSSVVYGHKGPVWQFFLWVSSHPALIPWTGSPVCSAAEAGGVVAGWGSQSVCWGRGVWGAAATGGPEACTRPASVLTPQTTPELSAERVSKKPPAPSFRRPFSFLLPCSAAPGWARWGRTTGWAAPGSWSRAKTGRHCTESVYWWGREQSWPRGSACTEGGCCPAPEKLLQMPPEVQRGPEWPSQLPSTILHTHCWMSITQNLMFVWQ